MRHLLKLSPEKWEEVANHAQAAVVPDFRHRAWWCPALKTGLLFACKNGAVSMDQPIGACRTAHTHYTFLVARLRWATTDGENSSAVCWVMQ